MTKNERLWMALDRRRDFLFDFSVVVRTQGNRPEVLLEALQSIGSQKIGEFEILLMVHTLQAESILGKVEESLAHLSPEIVKVIRLCPVTGGGRSRPLNQALDQAAGRWICFLDDDDLLLPNHFEVLLNEDRHGERSGAYSTYASTRRVRVLTQTSGATYPYEVVETFESHVKPFDLKFQLFDNALPMCNVFVHSELVRYHRLRFDESFDVLEDHRFWMDVHRFTEIVSLPVVTTAITERDNDSHSRTDPQTSGLWKEHQVRLLEILASQDRSLSADDMMRVVETMKQHREWEETFGKLGMLYPLVKTLALATARVRHCSPTPLRRFLKRNR